MDQYPMLPLALGSPPRRVIDAAQALGEAAAGRDAFTCEKGRL